MTSGDAPRSGVASPGAGEITTVGPVHFDLRATTSASRFRSANDALGWSLIVFQASFVGIVFGSSIVKLAWFVEEYTLRLSEWHSDFGTFLLP